MKLKVLNPFVDEIIELEKFIDCTLSDFTYSTYAAKMSSLARKVSIKQKKVESLDSDEVHEKQQKRYIKLEKFAKNEIEKGHPYLFSLACVKLWSILEAATDSLLVELLKSKDRLNISAKLEKIKGPLIDFLVANEEERIHILKNRFLQELSADLKSGIGKFEYPLHELGFTGNISTSIRRALLELSEVRNIVVHKSGRIDRRFRLKCPWHIQSKKENIIISGIDFSIYLSAAF